MSVQTAFTYPMTKWRAFLRLMRTQRLLKSPKTWMQKLRPCLSQLPESHDADRILSNCSMEEAMSNAHEFIGKRILVTGGSKGIGEAIVNRLRDGGGIVLATG